MGSLISCLNILFCAPESKIFVYCKAEGKLHAWSAAKGEEVETNEQDIALTTHMSARSNTTAILSKCCLERIKLI
jgi:hypothetical protein